MSTKPSKEKVSLNSKKDKVNRMVAKYASGSNSLQKSIYTTKSDLDERRSKAIAYDFS